jgi:hypothetical protein
MNLNATIRNLFIISAAFISSASEAIIVQGTFGGTVINAGDDSSEYPSYTNFWNEDPINKSMSGRFQYDTDLAPPMRLSSENIASYFNDNPAQPDWLTLEFFIDGRWLNVASNHSDGFETIEATQIVGIIDIDDPTLWAHGNYFDLLDLQVRENAAGKIESTYMHIGIMDPLLDIIHGLDLTQEFSWTKGGHADWGTGTYQVVGEKNGQPYSAWAVIDISTLTIAPVYTSIPEPSSFYLIAIGLLSFAIRFNRLNMNVTNKTGEIIHTLE